MYKLIVIDDEASARNILKKMLNLLDQNIEVVAEAASVAEAYKMIKKYEPDLVLLDIKLEDGTGFDLLKKFEEIPFRFIFTTAFEEYAIQAFRFSAIDYLLKPINPDELLEAIEKTKQEIEKDQSYLKMMALISNIENYSFENKKIILKTAETIHLVNVKEIVRCESTGNYTNIYLSDGKKHMVSKTLKEFDEMLTPYKFFRTHQSHLINLNYVEHFEKANGGVLILKNKENIPVSFRKKDLLFKVFENL